MAYARQSNSEYYAIRHRDPLKVSLELVPVYYNTATPMSCQFPLASVLTYGRGSLAYSDAKVDLREKSVPFTVT